MIQHDAFAEDILYTCGHCHRSGELGSDIREEEGLYFCWHCLAEMNKGKRAVVERRMNYALKREGFIR